MGQVDDGGAAWTAEKPTAPGWYWQRSTPSSEPLPVRIVRREFGAILFALVRGNEAPQNWTHKLKDIGGEWWPTPIELPEAARRTPGAAQEAK